MIYPDLLSEVYVSHKLHFYKTKSKREIAQCHQNLYVILVTK